MNSIKLESLKNNKWALYVGIGIFVVVFLLMSNLL
jgi:hypothetical protein